MSIQVDDGYVYRTPVVQEPLAIIPVVGGLCPSEMIILLVRLTGSEWIVGDVNFEVMRWNLADMEVVPVAADSPLAAAVLPCFAFTSPISVGNLSAMRVQAQRLGAILGGAVVGGLAAGAAGAQDVSWRYADPAHALFGQSCDAGVLGDPGRFRPVGATALLVESEAENEENSNATVLERVLEKDLTAWLDHKRVGAGRDARLSSFSPSSTGSVVLFSKVLVDCHREYKLPFQMFGDSPPALP